jgi:hypothetical protein
VTNIEWGLLLIILLLALAFAATLREWAYSNRMLRWNLQRGQLLNDVFQAAYIVISVPDHSAGMTVDGPGGNVVYQGTMLNYETLKSMLTVILKQEQDRRRGSKGLKSALAATAQYEHDNPQPKPPTYFGWRIPSI